MQNFSLILCCAGTSSRFGSGEKKEYLELAAFTANPPPHCASFVSVLSENIAKFLQVPSLQYIVLLIPQNDGGKVQNILERDTRLSGRCTILDYTTDAYRAHQGNCTEQKNSNTNTVTIFLHTGGATRQASVFTGLSFLMTAKPAAKNFPVLIHDAARPFFSLHLVETILQGLENNRAVIPGIPVVDTQKIINEKNFVKANLQRDTICAVQTPQGFYLEEIYEAHRAARHDMHYTDDSEIYFARFPREQILVIEGERKNKKITFAEDKITPQKTNTVPQYRVGFGYDLHRLETGKTFVLGGIHIPHGSGFAAHSDGDVLLHAVTDALLGAAGFSDIGELFPPNDSSYKNADSKILLQEAWKRCNENTSWQIQNIDCVVVTEAPKLLPYRQAIRESIAEILAVDFSRIFVKAKTAEKLGAIGAGQAVEVWATALLSSI